MMRNTLLLQSASNRTQEKLVKPKDPDDGTCLFYAMYNALRSPILRAKFSQYSPEYDRALNFKNFCC